MSDSSAISSIIPAAAPPEAGLLKPLAVLQAISHPVRWQILQMLAPGTGMTGTAIAAALGKYPDTVNKELRVMRDAGVVTCAPAADQRYLEYSVPVAFRREIGQIDYGFCVLRIATASPPVAKD